MTTDTRATNEAGDRELASAYAQRGRVQRSVKDFLLRYGSLAGLVVITGVFSVLIPTFPTVTNAITVLRQVSIVGTISLGMTFVFILGGLDLSVSNVPALAGSVAAVLLRAGYGNAASIFAGLAAGLLMGLLNGTIVTKLRVPIFLSGLAVAFVARGLDMWITRQETIYEGMRDNPAFLALGQANVGPLPTGFLIMGSLYVIIHLLMIGTRVGRNMYAIGGSEEGAAAAGIDINRYRLVGLALAGLFGALGGILMTSRAGAAVPRGSEQLWIDVIVAVVFGTTVLTGGVPHVLGTGVGVLFIGILLNAFSQLGLHEIYQLLAKGALLIGAVTLCSIGGRVLKLELR